MKISLRPLISAVPLLVGLTCNAAETNIPDCVGIRLGMSVTEARERLRSYDAKLEIQSVELPIPALAEKPVLETVFVVRMPSPPTGNSNSTVGGKVALPPIGNGEATETLQAAFTLSPNQPVVWKVVRSLRFEQNHEPTKTALLDALREKYGKESLTLDSGFREVSRFWVLGPDGSLLEGQAVKECSSFYNMTYSTYLVMDDSLGRGGSKEAMNRLRTDMFLSMIGFAHPMLQDPHHCNSMTYIVAKLSVGTNPELVNQMRVALIDAPLNRRAMEATVAMVKEANAAKAKQETDKAKGQQIPKL